MGETAWRGKLLHIFIAPEASAPMQMLTQACLIAGTGIEGDRYATGRGTYSNVPRTDRQCTLIEIEALQAVSRDYGIELTPQESRRNLATLGVPLNHLVGRRFRVGEVVLYGARLNVPCKYLERITGKAVFGPLTHRSGLNCEIETGGTLRPGDIIEPL